LGVSGEAEEGAVKMEGGAFSDEYAEGSGLYSDTWNGGKLPQIWWKGTSTDTLKTLKRLSEKIEESF
jgi:hypothetical protein